jgi:hypothetical protein
VEENRKRFSENKSYEQMIVGAIHESPVSKENRNTIPLYVILSGGRRVRPPTEVEVLLRE